MDPSIQSNPVNLPATLASPLAAAFAQSGSRIGSQSRLWASTTASAFADSVSTVQARCNGRGLALKRDSEARAAGTLACCGTPCIRRLHARQTSYGALMDWMLCFNAQSLQALQYALTNVY